MRFALLIAVLALVSCTNPFAPTLATDGADNPILGDQRTIEGVFQNFRFAYVFKDTATYSRLLDRQFTFVYRDYDKSVDVTWGRDDDMRATLGLFTGVKQIELIWNDIVSAVGNDTLQNISRGFNLTITISDNNVQRAQGRANFLLQRPDAESVWKIVRWRDESAGF